MNASTGHFRIFAVLCIVWVGLLVAVLLGPFDPRLKQVVSDLSFVGAAVVAAVSCGVTAVKAHDSRSRLGWSLLSAAAVCWSFGNVFWFHADVLSPRRIFPGPSDAFYLLAVPFAAAGLLALPAVSWRVVGPLRVVLDSTIVVASLLFIGWALLLEPIAASWARPLETVVLLTYPLGDVALMSLALIIGARAHPQLRTSLWLVGVGLFLYALSDSAYAYLELQGFFASATIADVGWVVGYLSVALAARAPGVLTAIPVKPHTRPGPGSIGLVYGPLVAAIVVAAGPPLVHRDPVLFTAGIVALAAFAGRQIVLVSENRSLTNDLEQRVEDRTRQLHRVSRRAQLILESASDGIYGEDIEGRIVFANPAAAAILGYGVNDLVGRSSHDLFHYLRPEGSPCPASECGANQALAKGEPYFSDEEVYVHRGGSLLPVEVSVTPIKEDASVVGGVVVFRDITERQAVQRMKDEFISVVSHELRTPLTAVRGSLDLLDSGALGELPVKADRMVVVAADNARRLNRLVNDILDMERIASGHALRDSAPCDAAGLVAEAVESVQTLADEAEVSITVGTVDGSVYGDGERLVQALTNLLSNAIKFSAAGAQVVVTAQPGADAVTFAVSDGGRGIPRDQLETIFQPFEQVDASDARDKSGTGLGLAICKSIVELHNGQIWVDSRVGEGSTFAFTVPSANDQR